MSNESTIKMLKAYVERSPQRPGFFTSFFQAPPENFYTQEEVSIDIVRSGQDIAPVLVAMGVGNNRAENRRAVNKRFKPPVYGEEFSLNIFDMVHRAIGDNPFQDVNYLANLQQAFFSEMAAREAMIRRAIELQCSQVLRTGALSLPAIGGVPYSLNYQPQATHFTNANVDWDEANPAPMTDVAALTALVAADGQHTPKYMIAGARALQVWLNTTQVQNQVNKLGDGRGALVPPQARNGGVYHGQVTVGNHVLEMWTTDAFYKDLNGVSQKYLGDWEVLILSENARLDLTFGAIPRLVPVDPRLASLAVGSVNSSESKISLTTNAWVSPPGTEILGSVGARPLAIPTAIDTFGRLNTKAT